MCFGRTEQIASFGSQDIFPRRELMKDSRQLDITKFLELIFKENYGSQ